MQFKKRLVMGLGALCLVAVAGIMRAEHLFYMAAILLTLPGVSYVLGWQALRGLEFEREIPHLAWEGEEGQLLYVVRNPSGLSRFFLSIHEELPGWVEPIEEESLLFNVAAEAEVRIAYPVRFQRRGVYAATGFEVMAMDPLGVFAFTRHIPAQGELVVYPLPQTLRNSVLSGTERYGWQEFTSQLLRGSSVDPDGVRPYVPGDSMRRIHWRQTAHTGKLSVIEFEEAQATNLVIALDLEKGTDIGDDGGTTLEYGVRLAASLAQEAVEQGAGVRLLLPSFDRQDEPMINAAAVEGRGQAHLFLILDALARVEANASSSLAQLLADNTSGCHLGTTLVVITSRPDPALTISFTACLGAGVKVSVIFIDPNTFVVPRKGQESNKGFLAALAALRLPTYVVRREENGVLDPEDITYVHTLELA